MSEIPPAGDLPAPKPVKARRRRKRKPVVHKAIRAIKALKAKRTCLNCDRLFTSRGPDNRICGKCKRSLGDMTLPPTYRTELTEEPEK